METLTDERAVLEHKIEKLQQVVFWLALIWTVMLMFMGVFFFPYVLIRWGFVK